MSINEILFYRETGNLYPLDIRHSPQRRADFDAVPACLQLPSRCNKLTFGQVRLETDKKPAKNHR